MKLLLAFVLIASLVLAGCTEIKDTSMCKDSDNGLNYQTIGNGTFCRTADDCKTETDYCYNEAILVEHYCKQDSLVNDWHMCRYGCENGACKESTPGSTDYVVKYGKDNLVKESRADIIRYGFSEKFFDEHFALDYFANSDIHTDPGSMIIWDFNYGEYTAKVDDNLGYSTQGNGNITYIHSIAPALLTKLPVIGDFGRVIPKSEAETLMKSCIGEFANARAELRLSGPDNVGFYFVAEPKENALTCTGGMGPCRIKQGIVDLLNGNTLKCDK